MGTPDFALESLKAIYRANHKILCVVTQPDKKVGRKQILTPSVVKTFADLKKIKTAQPKKITEITSLIASLCPEIIIVVAYGKILPSEILNLPKYGCINVHASLLPKYRGAAPIAWSIVNGEKTTGVSIVQMNKGLDTGNILAFKKLIIESYDTQTTISKKLASLGAQLLISTLIKIENNNIIATKQDEVDVSFAPILKKEFSIIDWNKTAQEIHNLVRGFYKWPCARTFLNKKILKILKTRVLSENTKSNHAGCVISKKPLKISCGNKTVLEILELQLEGKKPVKSSEFIKGNFFDYLG
jgi:methionyl-tRNA formyltransferase